MISITNLHFRYPSGEDVLTDLSLSIDQGSLVGLVGANGSGKSTLLSLLAGLYTPYKGTLAVGDKTAPGEEKAIRGLSRMVMQDADLQILGATVEEDLLLGRKRSASSMDKALELARRFRLSDAWDKPVQTLSWGMKRKLCLAAALMDEPRVLLLDEPFSGLDYPGMIEMRRMIAENRQAGLTQLVSSHDLECVVDLADILVVLDGGRLVLTGPPETILDHVSEHGIRPPCSWQAGLGIQPFGGDG